MNNFRRIAIFTSLSALLLSALFVFQNSTVHAWDSDYVPTQGCSELNVFYNPFVATNDLIFTFEQLIDSSYEPSVTRPIASDGFDPSNPNHSLIVYGDSTGGFTLAYETDIEDNINFSNTNLQLTGPKYTSSSAIVLDAFGEEIGTYSVVSGGVLSGGNTSVNNQSQVDCVHKAINLDYSGNYNGIQFESNVDDVVFGTDCDTLDIACQVGRLFTGVANTFVSVGEAIVNGIASLFIPDSAIIGDTVDGLITQLEDTLGFLYYPIELITDIVAEINNTNDCANSCAYVAPGTFFGGTIEIDPFAAEDDLPLLYDTVFTYSRIFTVLGVVTSYFYRYRSIIKHS